MQGLQPKRRQKHIRSQELLKTGKLKNPPGLASPGFSAKAVWSGDLRFPRAEARSKAHRVRLQFFII